MKTKRKLVITGQYTYAVTLPKTWVKSLRWRSKQMLELTLDMQRQRIVIKDFPNKAR
jgi:bifunctional DNA-binding transcriptional regulator/antitoxin component of YhaV-PrlF toxin-antitoxin module